MKVNLKNFFKNGNTISKKITLTENSLSNNGYLTFFCFFVNHFKFSVNFNKQ